MEPLDTAVMHWYPDYRQLTTEASDHDALRTTIPQTVDVRSHKTGRVLSFAMHHIVRSGLGEDAETVAWVYRNAETGLELRVLND